MSVCNSSFGQPFPPLMLSLPLYCLFVFSLNRHYLQVRKSLNTLPIKHTRTAKVECIMEAHCLYFTFNVTRKIASLFSLGWRTARWEENNSLNSSSVFWCHFQTLAWKMFKCTILWQNSNLITSYKKNSTHARQLWKLSPFLLKNLHTAGN